MKIYKLALILPIFACVSCEDPEVTLEIQELDKKITNAEAHIQTLENEIASAPTAKVFSQAKSLASDKAKGEMTISILTPNVEKLENVYKHLRDSFVQFKSDYPL